MGKSRINSFSVRIIQKYCTEKVAQQVTLCMARGGGPSIRGRARWRFFGRARCDGRALGLLLMARAGSLGLALIGANGVLILAGSSAGEYHPGQSDWWASLYQPCAVALAR